MVKLAPDTLAAFIYRAILISESMLVHSGAVSVIDNDASNIVLDIVV